MPFLKSGRSRVLKTSHTDGIALCAEASSSASLPPDDELFTEGSPSRATPSRPASASRSAPASNLDHPPTISSQPQDANVTINGVASAALQNTSLATRAPDNTAVIPNSYRTGCEGAREYPCMSYC